ncbi:MAG: MFS transporter [Deltaproteobacteria bacterium]|nr:MAG: MFS transporter [Deltaproteobacteria bacterium]
MLKRVFYGWWIVLACFFIGLYAGFVIVYGFTAFFQPIREEFAWSYTQISLAASLRALEMAILAPVAGFLVDRFGSRMLVLCGTIMVGFGLVLLSLTQSLATFYGGFLLLGLGGSGCMPVVTTAVVANWFQRSVGKALGIMASGMGAGGLMVPLIVWLMDIYDWRGTFLILGLGMWALGIPLSFVIRNKPEHYGYLPDGKKLGDPTSHPELESKQAETGFKEAVKERSFLFMNLAEAIRMMTVTAVVTHIMPYLNILGMPRHTAGFVAGALPFFSNVGRFGFGWFSDVFDKRYVMALAFFFLGIGLLALSYVQVAWIAVLFLLLFPLGFGGGVVLRGAILRDYFGRDSFGKLIGIIMGSAAIGEVIGPALAGWTFDTLGSYQIVWLAFSGAIGMAIILILRIKQYPK